MRGAVATGSAAQSFCRQLVASYSAVAMRLLPAES